MKPQLRGRNTKQVNRTVNFDLNNEEENADYEYTLAWGNFAGTVKKLIRAQRLNVSYMPTVPFGTFGGSIDQDENDLPQLECDPLDTLL